MVPSRDLGAYTASAGAGPFNAVNKVNKVNKEKRQCK